MSANRETTNASVSVVIATRDRRDQLLHTLDQLTSLPGRPPIIVVDNGSTDGSAAAARHHFPTVDVVAVGRNLGAPGRNVGVARATTPYVAFADDDSWWAPEALDRASHLFDHHPGLAVVAAQVLVGSEQRLDPVSAAMAASPLVLEAPTSVATNFGPVGDHSTALGPPVLGFLACGAVVRRDAFLAVGGFSDLLFFFGEEALLAMDLADAGWSLHYAPDVVAHHHPDPPGDPEGRQRRQIRNHLLTTWLRRPPAAVAAHTWAVTRQAPRHPVPRAALGEALVRLPGVVRERRRLKAPVEAMVRALE